MIKPIETVYNGYRFRSRLEARWAVFFDALGLQYRYEAEGFDLPDVGYYLPDFYLPKWDSWVEVKPFEPTMDELSKLVVLALGKQPEDQEAMSWRENALLLYGSPGWPKLSVDSEGEWKLTDGYIALCYNCLGCTDMDDADTLWLIKRNNGRHGLQFLLTMNLFAMVNGGTELDIWPIYFDRRSSSFTPLKDARTGCYASPKYPIGTMTRLYHGEGVYYQPRNLKRAYKAARQARFEHGASPWTSQQRNASTIAVPG